MESEFAAALDPSTSHRYRRPFISTDDRHAQSIMHVNAVGLDGGAIEVISYEKFANGPFTARANLNIAPDAPHAGALAPARNPSGLPAGLCRGAG